MIFSHGIGEGEGLRFGVILELILREFFLGEVFGEGFEGGGGDFSF